MSQLSCKVRKNATVYRLPKVYFCCHSKDFDAFFEEISEEILAKQNCSVWHHGKVTVQYNDDFFGDLSQMQLFVVPVTRRFLSKGNPALEVEFRYAVEHHIPILPLMQEQGLETEFNRLCGNIQFLDKYNNDSTCIEYAEKLEKFLAAILLGDGLTKKIRDAFDAYIFLSYRKKDRYHAQKLMRLIHENEFCRDIAIWYDEFLVPGEDFNDAISEALDRSKLFLLAVTPNLVNEDNYIMSTEFPMAQRRGKPILPCEMVDTDKDTLSKLYKNIPECTNGQDSENLARCLSQYFTKVASGERKSTPEHLFFIGLAYLNGIDVEVNRHYALELITTAAEQELPEAVEQLIAMYSNGIGVPMDTGAALRWHQKLLELTYRDYHMAPNFSGAMAHIRACLNLAQAEYDMNMFQEAIAHANRLKDFVVRVIGELFCVGVEQINLNRYAAWADLLLGRINQAMNDFDRAKEHFDLSLKNYEKLKEQIDDPQLSRDISILYVYIAQLCKVKAQYRQALDYYREALAIQQQHAEEYDGDDYLKDQVLTQVRMSEILLLTWDCEAAKQCCLAALEILDELMKVHKEHNYLGSKMLALLALAEALRASGDWNGALGVFEQLEQLEQQYAQRYGVAFYYVQAKRLYKMAQVYFQMEDYAAVIRYGEQTVALLDRAELTLGRNIATGGAEEGGVYTLLGMAYYNTENQKQNARKYLKLAADMADRYWACGILGNIPDILMIYCVYCDVLQGDGEPEEAEKYLKKAMEIYENNPHQEDNFREISGAFTLYMALGRHYAQKDMPAAAIRILEKAEQLYHRAVSVAPNAEKALYRDYALLTFVLAGTYADVDDLPRAKAYYLKCMQAYDRIPEEKYLLSDWGAVGIAAYQLYCMVSGFLARRKWEKRLMEAVRQVKQRYPTQYNQTVFYELLEETGIFD